MATSNFSGFDDASNSWFWNGNKTTADRYRYELSRQQETTLKQVNDLITREAAQVVAPAAGFSQQEYGGFLRQVVPTLLDQYGRVNATAAIQFYDQSRDYWTKVLSDASQGGRDARRSAATRFATARTRSSLAVAQGYAAQFADTYDTVSKTDAVVNFAMKVRAKSGHAPSVEAMNNALTREVASYHRDTVLFNSALDPYVSRVQRVAQATACEFCRLMALGSTNGKVRVSTYAAKFHSHCHCTIQPLFDGEQPVRPDYYDKFEKEYAEASKKGGSAKNILAEWRGNSKAANVAIPTPETSKLIKVPATKVAPKAPSKPEITRQQVTEATLRKDPNAEQLYLDYKAQQIAKQQAESAAIRANPTIPKQWWWQKDPKAINSEDLVLAQAVSLDQAGFNLKKLDVPDSIENAALVTNPRFSEGYSYQNNCARVSQAYELRRRGYDVVANGKNLKDNYSQSTGVFLRGWTNPATGKNALDEAIKVAGPNALKSTVESFPAGSRGAVWFRYPRKQEGHILNWENVDGKLLFVDAQPGKIGADAVANFKGIKLKDIHVVRLDNMEPSAQVAHYLEGLD